MSRNKKALPLLENILVADVATEGMAIARTEQGVVFIPFAAPGDIVDVQITKKKHNYMEGRIVRFVQKSDKRTEPFCEHFGICGGANGSTYPMPCRQPASSNRSLTT